MPTGYVKEAFEASGGPGNESTAATPSTKLLYTPALSVESKPNPKFLRRGDELRGSDESEPPLIPEAFEPTWEILCRAYPDLLGFRLKHILGAPTTTPGDGIITDPSSVAIPAGAYRHVWTSPFGPSGANPITTEMIQGYKDQSVFTKLRGAACAELELEFPDDGGVQVKASGPGTYWSRISDPSLTPAPETITTKPFVRGGLSIPTHLTDSGTIADFGLKIENPVATPFLLGAASKFPSTAEKDDEGPIVVSGSIPKRQLDAEDIDALMAGTGFALLAKLVSDSIITGSYKHTLWVAVDNAQYTEGAPDNLENKRRHGMDVNWQATYDGAGASVTVTLVNATSSYT